MTACTVSGQLVLMCTCSEYSSKAVQFEFLAMLSGRVRRLCLGRDRLLHVPSFVCRSDHQKPGNSKPCPYRAIVFPFPPVCKPFLWPAHSPHSERHTGRANTATSPAHRRKWGWEKPVDIVYPESPRSSCSGPPTHTHTHTHTLLHRPTHPLGVIATLRVCWHSRYIRVVPSTYLM